MSPVLVRYEKLASTYTVEHHTSLHRLFGSAFIEYENNMVTYIS